MRVFALALIAGLCFAVTAHAADYAESRAAYQRLDQNDRFMVGLMLVATGRYNGMIYGDFNKRLYRGIIEYQQSLGAAPTGILTADQTASLYREGGQYFAALGMKKLEMPLGAGTVFVPLALAPYSQRTERGIAYEAGDRAVSVDLSAYPPGEVVFHALYARLSKTSNRRQVTYKVLRDDFFVVSGTLDGRNYYTKYLLDRGFASGFTFAWDARVLPSGDRIAVLMSNSFFPAFASGSASVAEAEPAQPTTSPPPEPQRPASGGGISTGSGFFVTSDGLMVTNNHVVEKCTSITVGGSSPAVVAARDVGNDLALIRTSYPGTAAALRTASIGLGDVVYALGYPFAGTLDNGLNITNGLVSSLSGIQNDSRYVQITAAVQPGNSGGPLVDEFGNVAGVVSARLDDLNMLKTSGMLPQNVNFAIRSDFVMSFLRANSVEPTGSPSVVKQAASDIARAGRSFTAQIVCVEGP